MKFSDGLPSYPFPAAHALTAVVNWSQDGKRFHARKESMFKIRTHDRLPKAHGFCKIFQAICRIFLIAETKGPFLFGNRNVADAIIFLDLGNTSDPCVAQVGPGKATRWW